MIQEVVIPRVGARQGYVITKDYDKRQGLRQVQAFYMDKGDFFMTQWLKKGDQSDYSQKKTRQIDKVEFENNYHFDD
jgi:hypothetical protein